MATKRPAHTMDIENLRNFFLVKFRCEETGKITSFPMYEGCPLDIQGLVNMLSRVTIYTFNGLNYDNLVLTLALYGATNEQLKQAGDNIIQRGMKYWEFYDHYNIQFPDYIDAVDIMEVAPGVRVSLKIYGGRVHAPKIQDLPIEHDAWLTPVDMFNTSVYCDNDLETTSLLKHEIRDRLLLRDALSEKYKVDLRSKSDAQMAEAIFKAKLDFKVQKRYIPHGYAFTYTPPPHIQFVTPQMQEVLALVRNAKFVVSDKEEAVALGYENVKTGVQIPAELKGRDIRIGHGVYRMGIGGLHSQESCIFHKAIAGVQTLKDIDVKSYYPSMILKQGMVPTQLGEAFAIIYRAIYDRRLFTKDEVSRLKKLAEYMSHDALAEIQALMNDMQIESDGLKIVLNGVFGKLFSKHSIFYAPELGIATTIGGQLNLLMLIEMLELSGIRVVSANTDGIVLLIPHGYDWIVADIVKWWENATKMEMEAAEYSALYSRDVNNYIAFTVDGKVKRKGVFNPGCVFTPSALQGKNPDADICADAVIAYLKDGTAIARTIRQCRDIRKFVVVRGVTGGGLYLPQDQGARHMEYLGKAVRWYYGMRPGYIGYKGSHNKVAGSDGATPVMELPATLPTDINYPVYENSAMEMLADVGFPVRYWWHDESDSAFITLDDDFIEASLCVEIDAKTYKKRR